MQRVLGIGVALGILAAFVSWMGGDDDFCRLARDDGLVAERSLSPDQRREYRARLDDAADTAPGDLADDVRAIREAAEPPGGVTAVRSPRLADERSSIGDWVGEHCA